MVVVEEILDNYRRAMDRMEHCLRDVVTPFENAWDGENRFSGIDDIDDLAEWVVELNDAALLTPTPATVVTCSVQAYPMID